MAEADDAWRAPTGCVAMGLCLAGGYVGHEFADACVVAWWQRWGQGGVQDLGIIAGCALGMTLGFALMRSLRDAVALVRSAPPPDAGEEQSSKTEVLSRGLVALALLVTFGALAAVGFRGLGWREVRSPDGGFRVVMPGKPIVEKEEENTREGRATGKRFMCRGAEQGYMWRHLHIYGVAFLDYPQGYVARNTPAEIFKEQRDSLVPSEGKLVSEKAVSLGRFPGTELRIEARDGQVITCRLFLVRQRLYTVLAKYPRSDHSRGVDTFFDSFALTEN